MSSYFSFMFRHACMCNSCVTPEEQFWRVYLLIRKVRDQSDLSGFPSAQQHWWEHLPPSQVFRWQWIRERHTHIYTSRFLTKPQPLFSTPHQHSSLTVACFSHIHTHFSQEKRETNSHQNASQLLRYMGNDQQCQLWRLHDHAGWVFIHVLMFFFDLGCLHSIALTLTVL